MKVHKVRAIKLILLLFVVINLGCTSTYRIPDVVANNYPDSFVYDAKVGIAITQDFKDSKYVQTTGGTEETIYFGSTLVKNTKYMLGRVFKVAQTYSSANNRTDFDLIATPKMVWFNHIMDSEIVATIAVEWEFTDKNNNLVWVETIIGEGHSPHSPFKSTVDRRYAMMINDLYTKSYLTISNSPEINNYFSK